MTRESHDPTEFEPLPPELEALHYRLLADGAVWRDGLPNTDHLEERLSEIHRQERVPQPARARNQRREATTPFPAAPKGVVSVFPGRIKTVTAIVAIAAVVALFAFLFRGFAIGHTNTGTSSPPSGQSSQVAPGYYDVYLPVIAPSDPLVIYKVAQKGQATPEMVLARSDNGGRTWQTFALPAGKANDQLVPYVYVSPLNAHTVFLLVDTRQKYGDCTASQAFAGGRSPLAAHSGGNPLCAADTTYLSTDGGQHWTQPQFPQVNGPHGLLPQVPGDTAVQSLVTTSIADSAQVFRAQGNRLYTDMGLHPGVTASGVGGEDRLITSTDGGATWSLADNGLPHDGAQDLCDYSPTPTGSTIFAIVGSCSSELSGTWSFWRSDDAGAHWTQVFVIKSALASTSAFLFMGMMAVGTSDGKPPLVYLDLADTANGFSPSADTVMVYGTSERALLGAPTQGFPDGQNPGRPVGVLSDGSVLFATDNGFYSWKAGDASWKKLAPKVNGVIAYAFLTAPGADGKQTLVVVTRDNKITRLGV